LKAAGQGVTVINVAKTGSKMKDLGAQLRTAAASNADLVEILMGANDLCVASVNDMTPTATFTSQFRGALANFMAAKPGAYVYVSSIPNLATLYNLMSTKTAAKVVWTVGRMCPSMLSLSESNGERMQVAEREVEFNNALKTVCATFTHCRYDNSAAYSVKFTEADVSTIDYFHPSPAGQAKLAAAEWASGFWSTTA
jgi:lysophospholipase L1-like esterase